MYKCGFLLVCGTTFLIIFGATPAIAQTSSGDAVNNSEPTTTLEPVTVTARKREESILTVPVDETVIGQDMLQRYGTNYLTDLSTDVPGLLVGARATSNGSELSIRGVGTTANNPTIDQSTSLVIDGMPISQGLAYTAGMFDLGEVEVLKGPQALFYGKNNTAGVISLRSADPTDEVEVMARGGYETEAISKIADLVISGPVTDYLKLRLASEFSSQDGYFTNTANAIPGLGGVTPTFRNDAPETISMVRLTALFNPDSQYDARFKMNYTHDLLNGDFVTASQVSYCPQGTGGVPPVNIAFIGGNDCTLNRTAPDIWMNPANFPGLPSSGPIPNDGRPMLDTHQVFGSLEQNFHINSSLTLTSVTGYYDTGEETVYATISDTVPVLGVVNTFSMNQITEELRLASNFTNSPVNFMAGAFYQSAKQNVDTILRANQAFPLPPLLGWAPQTVNIESKSLYGQGIWKILPKLELAAGARWTDEDRTHRETNLDPIDGPIGPVPLLDPRITSNNVSPEASLTYTPTGDLTLYGSYKEGYKSGSFNTVQYISPTTPSAFGDESVKGGEIGLKSLMLDRTLLVDFDAYHYHYSGLQVGATTVTNGALAITTVNAASAIVEGFDLDATYAVPRIQGLTIRGATNYNKADFESFPNAPCGNGQTISQGCNQIFNPATGLYTAQSLGGRPLIRAPLWSGNLQFDYEMHIDPRMTLTIGENTSFSSRYYTALVELPGFEQSDFVKIGANVSLKGANNAWEVALIGSNLTNRFTSSYCANANAQNGLIFGGQIAGGPTEGPAGEDEAICYPDPPRQILLQFTIRPLALLK